MSITTDDSVKNPEIIEEWMNDEFLLRYVEKLNCWATQGDDRKLSQLSAVVHRFL